ncbi:hypothetical protein [Winogradskyella jejuensis]|uniref:Lipocalin-like domain-containing protein n=1 Tax=Winogradskyella jejuensis TaxID=1089305 RepID=A0A1M5SWT7_9FLAO|nr:hypothetical protein [Winogradskyella jejuensis]SHH43041.1 hypothetical protein SAMN05444148_1999 [Winogradskyella jejuensis]
MRNTFSVCLLLLFTYAVISCQENNEYLGDWELQSWSFDIEMDLNNDNTSSFNLLEETSCVNQEVLTLKSNNTLGSKKTFSSNLRVSKEGAVYKVSEKCNKGSLGFSSAFKKINDTLVLEEGGEYILNRNKLTRTFKGFIKVYNQDFSEVLETKDLVLTYIRKYNLKK